MKRILLILVSSLFFLFLYSTNINTANAQGSCTCSLSTSWVCGILPGGNNCNTGYYPDCDGKTAHDCTSCACVLVDPDVDCGGVSEPCGPNDCCLPGLTCSQTATGLRCLGVGQLCCQPGGPPPGTDCSGITCASGTPINLFNDQKFFCNPSDGSPSTFSDAGGINTAIGCIPMTTTGEFTAYLLRFGIGIAGGIAFILIIYAGFMVITSSGNPQKLQAGKELLTAAISGLLLLIFGTFVLEFIGVDILNLPGFGE